MIVGENLTNPHMTVKAVLVRKVRYNFFRVRAWRKPVYHDMPFCWNKQSVDQFDQCGLPASIWAEKADNLSAPKGQIQIRKGKKTAVFFCESLAF